MQVDTGLLNISLYISSNQTGPLTDKFSIIPNLTSTEPLQETYTGVMGVASLLLSITLACADNYYGPDCAMYCVGSNDSTGHYTCNETSGSIVCLEGYTNTALNCSQCISAPNCCEYASNTFMTVLKT